MIDPKKLYRMTTDFLNMKSSEKEFTKKIKNNDLLKSKFIKFGSEDKKRIDTVEQRLIKDKMKNKMSIYSITRKKEKDSVIDGKSNKTKSKASKKSKKWKKKKKLIQKKIANEIMIYGMVLDSEKRSIETRMKTELKGIYPEKRHFPEYHHLVFARILYKKLYGESSQSISVERRKRKK